MVNVAHSADIPPSDKLFGPEDGARAARRAGDPFGTTPRPLYECGLSDAAIVLYGWLSARYGGYKAGIFPGVPTLAAERGCSVSKIHYVVRELTEAGWLEVIPRPGDTNMYRLATDAGQSAESRSKKQKRRSPARGVSSVTGVSNTAPGGVTDDRGGVSLVTPNTAIPRQLEEKTATAFFSEEARNAPAASLRSAQAQPFEIQGNEAGPRDGTEAPGMADRSSAAREGAVHGSGFTGWLPAPSPRYQAAPSWRDAQDLDFGMPEPELSDFDREFLADSR